MNPALTAATQWFERTLDDSANRRLAIPEAFLTVDAILTLYLNVVRDLVVYPKVIEQHYRQEITFMATENILMQGVKAGGDRQELHEKIRRYANQAGERIKAEGLNSNLCELITGDPQFHMTPDELSSILKPENFVGRAPEQVDEFIRDCVNPVLERHHSDLGIDAEVSV
jgi:adenylosuccinate lyase